MSIVFHFGHLLEIYIYIYQQENDKYQIDPKYNRNNCFLFREYIFRRKKNNFVVDNIFLLIKIVLNVRLD